ncbi:crossover junction endodeoxyribonuclease RuvC [Indioceanicola profundi]|uniref:crossover junction endodeoxyribonuclease RuvC n=1 Tax=Indioceanicola profundi TaxID=2220096 RepID=UPI000E6ADAFE|nr:crossover junction endodeoxyribonuclease RuvC [Indioceanicola profundi]
MTALSTIRVLGLDPGLRHTGWGVIDVTGNRLSFVADGAIHTNEKQDLSRRLEVLHDGILDVIRAWTPDEAAVEETLANKNPSSTLKLGMARGIALLVTARAGLPVEQYLPMIVKKSVVGTGHADKAQVQHMVRMLLPGSQTTSADAADALAVAICHAHTAGTKRRVLDGMLGVRR